MIHLSGSGPSLQLTSQQIDDFEAANNLALGSQFRALYLAGNGGEPSKHLVGDFEVLLFFPLLNDDRLEKPKYGKAMTVESVFSERHLRSIPEGLLLFARSAYGGLFAMRTSGKSAGSVVHRYPDGDEVLLANSFAKFLARFA